jgi:hypothetical protein
MADDPKGWVFRSLRPGLSRLGHRTHMGRPFQRAVIRAGLDSKKVTPHVMRHTAITDLVQSGVDLPTIQKVSGHKTLAMVLRYTHAPRAPYRPGRERPGDKITRTGSEQNAWRGYTGITHAAQTPGLAPLSAQEIHFIRSDI